MPFCAVKWCGKRSQTSNLEKDGITFHRFPTSAVIKDKWMHATKRDDNWFPSKNSVICSRHFTEDCFRPLVHRRILFPKSVPTLMLPCMGPSEIYVVAPFVSAPAVNDPLEIPPLVSTALISTPLVSAQLVSTPLISASLASCSLVSTPLVSASLIPLIKVEKLPPTEGCQNNLTVSSNYGENQTNKQTTAIHTLNLPPTCKEKQLQKTVNDLSEILKKKIKIIKRLRDCNRLLKRRVLSLKMYTEVLKYNQK